METRSELERGIFSLSLTRKDRYKFKFLCRSICFLAVIGTFCAYNFLSAVTAKNWNSSDEDQFRRLDGTTPVDDDDCGDRDKADPAGYIVFYIFGVLYTFLALAIACDEFFVPALEEMASENHLDLSPDVAGATLMAAGGSAPELFTSFIGTFQESDIGFGTIVGSAVFNVLFVIAMCAFLSKDVLTLTWWPLFRDCVYYSIGLCTLAVFVGVNSADEIEMWEAIVLFALYLGYIVLMRYHENLYAFLMKRYGKEKDAASIENGSENQRHSSAKLLNTDAKPAHIQLNRHATFRAGVLKLLHDPYSWMNTAGVGIVSKISGDVNEVFKTIDKNGDGTLSVEEMRELFNELEMPLSDAELINVINQVDVDGDGKINPAEFSTWYIRSENRMRNKVLQVFKRFDVDKSGSIDREEVRGLLEDLEPRVTEKDVDAALNEMYQSGDKELITYEEFEDWYMNSLFWESQKKEIEEELETIWENLKRPAGEGFFSHLRWITLFPLVFAMAVTIPDVRNPKYANFCYLSFVLSICWIGVFSFFMVNFTEIIGATIGIPSVVMGLTFVAAGTSVPDLLSSVIVAKLGEGDMAVSSSVGSNIFDILVGFPIPWIAYIVYPNDNPTVLIESDGTFLSILILLGMLVGIATIIHFHGWKLTNGVGTLMIFLYFAFLVQAVVRELPFTC